MSSIHIPLVNLTDLCKKFGTRWHMCAKTCAKSTIFQICLYETILNGNNLNYIYNFHKFKLFSIVSVLLSSICASNSYFPMQKFLKIFPSTSSTSKAPPTISAKCDKHSRKSCETKSPERFISNPSCTRWMDSKARTKAS